MGRKRKARGLESEGKGHCGFLWPPLLVNKPGRVKLDKRKRPYKQCDHLEWRGGGWVEGGSARRAASCECRALWERQRGEQKS